LTVANRIIANRLLGRMNSTPFWYRPERGDTAMKIARRLREMVIDGLSR
jgi:hypothetical protein